MPGITFGTKVQTRPVWLQSEAGGVGLLPGPVELLSSAFNSDDTVVVELSANEAIGQTVLSVVALNLPLPAGAMLRFGAGEYAYTTAAAAAGATTITVEALEVAIESGDIATYTGTNTKKRVAGGTLVGRTFTERAASTPFGPWTSGDEEVLVIAFDLEDLNDNALASAVMPKTGVIIENLLPQWDNLTAGQKAALRAAYTTIVSPV